MFRSQVLAETVSRSFGAAETSLSIDDFGKIFRDALTSWAPVVLELDEEFDQKLADSAELTFGLEQTVDAMIEELSENDRLVLRSKLSGAPDAELASLLGVSRPTAAKRKQEAFAQLRHAWEAHAGEVPPEQASGLAQLIYLKLGQVEAEG